MTARGKEDWMNSKWRPAMGWMYMIVCVFDFVIFPILWSVLQAANHGSVTSQWQPLTLQGAGLFHIAMGAIVGVTAWSRGQEKLGGANNGGLQYVDQSVTTTHDQPQTNNFGSTGGFDSSATASRSIRQPADKIFGASQYNRFGNGSPPVVTGFGGKPGPVLLPDPEL